MRDCPDLPNAEDLRGVRKDEIRTVPAIGGVAQGLSGWLLTSMMWVRIPPPSLSFAAHVHGQSCTARRFGNHV